MRRLRDWLTCFVPAVPWLITAALMVAVLVILLSALRPKAHAQFGGVQQPMFGTQSSEVSIPMAFMQLWLKPESIAALTNDQEFSVWVDSSGNFHNGTNTVDSPLAKTNALNGFSAGYFDGGAGRTLVFYTNNGLSMLRNCPGATIYMVMTGSDAAPAHYPFYVKDNGGSKLRLGVYGPSAGYYAFNGKSIDADADQLGTAGPVPPGAGVFFLMNIRVSYTGQSWSLFADGVEAGGQTGMGWTASNTSDTDSAVSDGNALGYNNYVGKVVETILYSTNHTDAERLQVEAYITNKYGAFSTWPGRTNSDLFLLSRYDATSLALNDGDLVSNVPDTGPFAYNLLADGSARPYWTNSASVLNGTNAFIVFDGSSDVLGTNFTTSFPQPTLMFIVAEFPAVGSGGLVYADCSGDASVYQVVAGVAPNQMLITAGAEQFGVGQVTTWQVWEVMFNGANSYLKYNNGTVKISGSAGTNARKGTAFGASRAGAQFTAIKLAYAEIYTNNLSAYSIVNINRALKTRFGL